MWLSSFPGSGLEISPLYRCGNIAQAESQTNVAKQSFADSRHQTVAWERVNNLCSTALLEQLLLQPGQSIDDGFVGILQAFDNSIGCSQNLVRLLLLFFRQNAG